MQQIRDFALLAAYCGAIFFASSLPTVPVPPLFLHQDKLIHLAAYAVMGFFAWRCFRHKISNRTLLGFWTVGFCSLYGFSDEFHQYFVPGRSASVYDWIADTTGALLLVFLLLRYKVPGTLIQ